MPMLLTADAPLAWPADRGRIRQVVRAEGAQP
jgi:hypothetical protein